ncbi:hypothetical protein JW964_19575 [candidate division KSB1 bacterium]|nr:hypothetical protein [candidate division KSB1 bacterium]
MESRQYACAGWLSIANAVLLIPTIGFAIFFDYIARSFPMVNLFQILLSILFCVLGVYILLLFRKLLNERYQFYQADNMILTLIWINIIFTVSGFFKYLFPGVANAKLITDILGIALFYLMGIINIIFGIRILKLKDNLFGLRNPFAYTTIGSGVGIVSLVLMPFGLLAAVAAYIIQGIIFLRAAEEAEFV